VVPFQIGILILFYAIELKPYSISPPTERNLIEFEAENRDWRCACLEDEMYTCSDTQELIHPAHVETMQYTVSGSLTDFRQIST
jgi:hypothetical protein